jgi:hypothetical protein
MAEGGESVHIEEISDTLGALLRLLGVLIPLQLEHDGLSYVDHTRLLEAMLRNGNAREEARERERGRGREREGERAGERGREWEKDKEREGGRGHAEGATAQQSRTERDGNDGQTGERRQRSAQQRAGEGERRVSKTIITILSNVHTHSN